MTFEWDVRKAAGNLLKHGVAFEEAATVFGDPLSLTIPDPRHSSPGESRHVIMGESGMGRLLVVVHWDRGDRIRIISARIAASRERRQYEAGR
ncbi:MAG: BrnT family toxin [Candidatus Coatesbacteria bacterium]